MSDLLCHEEELECDQLQCGEILASPSSLDSEQVVSALSGDHSEIEPELLNMVGVEEHVDLLRGVKDFEENYIPREMYVQYVQSSELASVRKVLVNWICELCEGFQFKRSTAAAAVNILDRFLSLRRVSRSILQLAAACSLLIASKTEEVSCPSIPNLVHCCANIYQADDFTSMEMYILKTLEWKVNPITAHSFLQTLLTTMQVEPVVASRALDLIDLGLEDTSFLAFKPSEVAVSGVLCALEALGADTSPAMCQISNMLDLSPEDMRTTQISLRPLFHLPSLVVEPLNDEKSTKGPQSPVNVLASANMFAVV